MANDEHVAMILEKGVEAWNAWRKENPDIRPDLSETDRFIGVNLSGADLSEALLMGANLFQANLSGADLSEALLNGANLFQTNLSGAHLTRAFLAGATLLETDLAGADLTGCRVYGVSAWRLKLEGTSQQNLVITDTDEPEITVDNIEVAQFIYLLLHNEKIRDVIDTIG